jgi:transposase-like protein
MKTQISKPSAGKTLFTAEYKEEAVNHWKESGRSAATVAAELGIRAPLLYRWAQQLRGAPPPGGAPAGEKAALRGGPPELKTAARVAALEGRIRQLSEENAKLLEQREVLKKSLGILSEVPPRGMPGSSR